MGYSVFDETMVDLPWPAVEQAAAEGAIVLLPTGVIEEHGPHMSLGVDAYLSYLACKLTRRELESRGVRTLVAPPFYWGINHVTGGFPGSFTVRESTMHALLYDILGSLKRWGFTYVFNINWQGDHDHNVTLFEAVQDAVTHTGIRAFCILSKDTARRFGLNGKEPYTLIRASDHQRAAGSGELDIHAGCNETSIMAGFFPDQVDTELARTLQPTGFTPDDLAVWRRGWETARQKTPQGYVGSPAAFDPARGQEAVHSYARSAADVIQAYLQGSYRPPEAMEQSGG